MSLQIRRLSYCLGADVSGVDLRNPPTDEIFAKIHSAFLDYGVLLFRGQQLTQAQHVAISRRFGELEVIPEHRVRDRASDYPEILLVSNRPRAGEAVKPYIGEGWHSDRSNTCRPASASLLHAVQIPDIGGDTMFANLYLAYESLSDGMKRIIDPLHAVHMMEVTGQIDTSSTERQQESRRRNTTAQPLVRTHPETGRKALFVGAYKVRRIVGLTAAEGSSLLQFLCDHAAQARFVYRHRWQQGDLLVWDNRCTNHMAVGDFDRSQIRHMERTTVIGTPSGYPYEGPWI